ncbi:36854_t:CDS:1, partial [Gigaspora margarita]
SVSNEIFKQFRIPQAKFSNIIKKRWKNESSETKDRFKNLETKIKNKKNYKNINDQNRENVTDLNLKISKN